MSSILLIRRKGDPQIYADIQDDAGRDAWYQPVSPEAIAALGLSDKNIRFAGNVNGSLIRGGALTADSLKSLATQMLQGAKSSNTGVGNLQDIVSGNASNAFGTHATNFDPSTPEQDANDAKMKGVMSAQNDAQLALEKSVASQNKNVQPPPGTTPSGGNKISAAMAAPSGGSSTDGSGYSSDQLSDIVQVKLPNGAIMSVPRNSNIAATYGIYTPDQTGADVASGQGGAGQASPGGAAGAGSYGSGGSGAQAGSAPSANAGASQLPPVYEQALKSLQNYIDTLTSQGKSVNPELQLTPETVNKFMEQAKTELAPWHAQQIGNAQLDLQNELKYNAEEQQQTRQNQDMAYQQNQEQTAAAAAERGIADSGIRALAESRLKSQYTGLVESTRRRFEQQQRAAGLSGERTLGSANMPNLAGIPAVEGQAYKPQGGLTGAIESQQKADVLGRAGDLAAGKRTMDASLIV